MTDDIRDILDLDRPGGGTEMTKEAILGGQKSAVKPRLSGGSRMGRRPEGMAREVYALLYNDNKDAPPLFPTDTGQGYKTMKAKLSMKSVRQWKWVPFTNPARTDSAVFHHWRRVTDQNKEYPFAKFNKQVALPSYTDPEYTQHLESDTWSKSETDQLLDLCKRFDLRWGIIKDRWTGINERSIEDLKQRYYQVLTALAKVKTMPGILAEAKTYVFDADHERRRKEQLQRLYKRTPQQIEEEQMLQNELRKIEARKKERDKKTQDLHKLITAADGGVTPGGTAVGDHARRVEKKVQRKKLQPAGHLRHGPKAMDHLTGDIASIKFPDSRGSGVTLRSQRMKLPANIGQKKAKAIEQLLNQINVEVSPIPTEAICTDFNELRSDLVLLYELKTAKASCEFELQTLRHQYEAENPGKTLLIPPEVCVKEEPGEEVISQGPGRPKAEPKIEPGLSQSSSVI